jgi:uncharacterized repeat protein (TIGR01451 family)
MFFKLMLLGALASGFGVAADPVPDLTVAVAHAGVFTQGQSGAIYTITVTNSGGAVTTGAVTVLDALPNALTATAMGGPGWSCTLSELSCTRADALAGASDYPAITLTVNVAPNAPATVTNAVAAFGGGETDTLNDTASDVTAITPSADLRVAKTHAGSFAQGQTGAVYTITVSNAGSSATSGTVTAIDSLPAAFTATAMSGAGWDCTLSMLTCTRGDALAGGASYPAITLAVNVSPDAPASVTNAAAVYGGGEIDTANDTAGDVTSITPVGHECTYTLGSGALTWPASGGPGTVAITAGDGCSWTVANPPDWVTLTGPSAGSGNA